MCKKHYCCAEKNCESVIDCAIRASEKVFHGLCKRCGDSLTRRHSRVNFVLVDVQKDPVIHYEKPKGLL